MNKYDMGDRVFAATDLFNDERAEEFTAMAA